MCFVFLSRLYALILSFCFLSWMDRLVGFSILVIATELHKFKCLQMGKPLKLIGTREKKRQFLVVFLTRNRQYYILVGQRQHLTALT